MEEKIYKIDLTKYGYSSDSLTKDYYFSNYGKVFSFLLSGERKYLKLQKQRNGGLYHFYQFTIKGKKKNVSVFKLYNDYVFKLDNFNLYKFFLVNPDLGYIQTNLSYELKKKFEEPSEEFKQLFEYYYSKKTIIRMIYYLVKSMNIYFPPFITYDDLIQECMIYLYQQSYQYDYNDFLKKRYKKDAFVVFLKINIKRSIIRYLKLKSNYSFYISYDDIKASSKSRNQIRNVDTIKMYSLYDSESLIYNSL